jgi:hypothetical protein
VRTCPQAEPHTHTAYTSLPVEITLIRRPRARAPHRSRARSMRVTRGIARVPSAAGPAAARVRAAGGAQPTARAIRAREFFDCAGAARGAAQQLTSVGEKGAAPARPGRQGPSWGPPSARETKVSKVSRGSEQRAHPASALSACPVCAACEPPVEARLVGLSEGRDIRVGRASRQSVPHTCLVNRRGVT